MRLLAAFFLALLIPNCASTPGARALPADETRIAVVANQVPPPAPDPVPAPAAAPAEPAPAAPAPDPASAPPRAAAPIATVPAPASPVFNRLELDGVKGGRLTFVLPGSVDQVAAMLVDFDHAEGHRSWAASYRTLSRAKDRVEAEWKFRGKLGIHPTVKMELRSSRDAKGFLLRFHLTKTATGIASFFGDYRLVLLAGKPAHTRITERVFIDSGLWIANASYEDIEKGLREDARLMTAWMAERDPGSP